MKRIPLYKFYKHKYGSELLIDVVDYERMWPDIRRTPVFSETFYSITLVEEGDEPIELNGTSCTAKRGMAICSVPGDVWRFQGNMSMRALNLVFEKEFLLGFFRDNHFLDRFEYLAINRSSPFLQLQTALFDRLLYLYREMKREIDSPEQTDAHILRAMLYEALMLLARAEPIGVGQAAGKPATPISHLAERFVQLVDTHLTTQSCTAFYAD